MKKTGRWTRKTIHLEGCEPFAALVDLNKADHFGRHYGVSTACGAYFYPEQIKPATPSAKVEYEELEKQFGDV